jgi:hypothetical protein
VHHSGVSRRGADFARLPGSAPFISLLQLHIKMRLRYLEPRNIIAPARPGAVHVYGFHRETNFRRIWCENSWLPRVSRCLPYLGR